METVAVEPPRPAEPDCRPPYLGDLILASGRGKAAPRSVTLRASALLGLRATKAHPAEPAQWVKWDPLRPGVDAAERLQQADDPLPLAPVLVAEPLRGEDGMPSLRFGDSVLVSEASSSAGDFARLEPHRRLCTAPHGAAEVEEDVAAALRASGRVAEGFLPVTAAPPNASPPGRRGVWQLHRANPLDGFPDVDVLHYGQPLRFGQRHARAADGEQDEELVLSAEPPVAGGGGRAPYLVLARSVGFGDPRPDGAGRQAFHSVFQLFPCGHHRSSSAAASLLGAPVDPRVPVELRAMAPAAYSHTPRFLRLATSPPSAPVATLGAFGEGASAARALQRASAHGVQPVVARCELALEAADASQLAADTEAAARLEEEGPGHGRLAAPSSLGRWFVHRLALTPAAQAAQRAAEASVEHASARASLRKPLHRPPLQASLARALLGRALAAPPTDLRVTATGRHETAFARWGHLRAALLPRLRARGPLGLAVLRKTLVARAEPIIQPDLLDEVIVDPAFDEPLRPLERCAVALADVAAVCRVAYGLIVGDADLGLIGRAFAFVPSDDIGRGVDVDAFVDALRGEITPGRMLSLARLYAHFQREEGTEESLDVQSLSRRLAYAAPWEGPEQGASPDELVGALPLLRAHTKVPLGSFQRWMCDLTFCVSDHAQFDCQVAAMWGLPLRNNTVPPALSSRAASCVSGRALTTQRRGGTTFRRAGQTARGAHSARGPPFEGARCAV